MNNNEHKARFFVLLGLAVALCILCTPVAAVGRPIVLDLTSTVPVADFSASPTSGTAPLPVQFTDLSTGDGISAWAWDFDNDGVIDSTEQNPSYIYTTAGNYSVNLTVSGTDGNGEVTKTDYITVTEPVPAQVAEFTGTPVSGDAPLTVAFTDASTGTISSYAWDFDNDGVVDSTDQDPQHIYSTAGTYTVNLTVTGPGGSNESIKTDYITVTEPVPVPVAQFTGTPVYGDAPLTVDFTDASTGTISSYAWDFDNDGVIDSTEQNPEYIYTVPGIYTVNLTVVGPGGSDDEVKTDYITVTEPIAAPVAQFTGTPVSGDAPLTVAFTDASTGTISSYAWDFDNDGVIDSTEQNPEYIYTVPGIYTVNLTVVGPGGSNNQVKTDYITVTEPVPAPVAEFTGTPVSGDAPLTVDFTDASTGTISSYAWDFDNDGVIDSTEQNPEHVYSTAGIYTVNLTVTGPDGSDDEVKTDYITVTEPVPAPVAEFTGTPVSGDAPLTVAFTDESTGTISSYAWDFDNDGIVDSTAQNPQHIYSTAGTYTVNLTVVGPGGSNNQVKTDYINVTSAPAPERVKAEIRIEPETLNLKSSGVFTVFITLPGEYSITGINRDSLVCEGAHAKSVNVINATKNEYMAKFDRKGLVNVIPGDAVMFTVTGNLDTETGVLEFAGNDMVRVIK